MVAVARDRLKAFSPEQLHRNASQADALDAAQDAGVSLRMMREKANLSIEALAAMLDIPVQRLAKAEAGRPTRLAVGGGLYETPAGLLIQVARVTGQKSIPLPGVERD